MRGHAQCVRAALISALALGGCEPVKGVADSGTGEDAAGSIDAATGPDATPLPPGTVTVRAFDDQGTRIAGATVVFNAPNGEQLSRTVTDGTGAASADNVPPGASVTVARSFNEGGGGGGPSIRHRLDTVIGLQPGDTIEIGPRTPEPPPGPLGALRLAFNEPVDGAGFYTVHVGCNSFPATPMAATTNIALPANECNGGIEPVDVLMLARVDSGRPLAFQSIRNVALDITAVDANNWNTNIETFTVKLSGIPAAVAAATIELGLINKSLDYGFENTDLDLSAGDTAQADFSLPRDFAQVLRPRVFAAFGASGNVTGVVLLAFAADPTSGQLDVDVSEVAPPAVTSVNVTQDAANFTLSFQRSGPTNNMDSGGSGLRWSAGDVTNQVEWEWSIMMPPGVPTTVQLPILPTDVVIDPNTTDHSWPPPADATLFEALVGFIDTSLAQDFADFRKNRGFSLFDDPLPASEANIGDSARITIGGTFSDDFNP